MARKDETIGGRIRRLREARGLSHDRLAKELGTGRGTVIRWEGGDHYPSARWGYPRKLADYFGEPEENFTAKTETKSPVGKRVTVLEDRVSRIETILEKLTK